MRKLLLPLSLLMGAAALLPSQIVKADILSLSFDPLPAFQPGDTVTLTGVLTNTTSDVVFLHGDQVSLDDPTVDITLEDLPFFLNAPFSLEPNGTVGDTYTGPFLDITIGPGVAPGLYTGTLQLNGGATPTLDTPLVIAPFTIAVTPEPQTWTMLSAAGVCSLGLLKKRKRR